MKKLSKLCTKKTDYPKAPQPGLMGRGENNASNSFKLLLQSIQETLREIFVKSMAVICENLAK